MGEVVKNCVTSFMDDPYVKLAGEFFFDIKHFLIRRVDVSNAEPTERKLRYFLLLKILPKILNQSVAKFGS